MTLEQKSPTIFRRAFFINSVISELISLHHVLPAFQRVFPSMFW